PFFSLYLFWLRWQDRPEPSPPRKTLLPWILIGVPALLLLLPIRLFEIGTPEWRPLGWIHTASVAALTLLSIWSAGGNRWLRHFAFPIAFFFVAVPWVTPIEVPIIQGLMRAVAGVAAETVTLFGIPTHLEGNLMRVSSGLVGVNEACSGVRSLQTALIIGLIFRNPKSAIRNSASSFILPTSCLLSVLCWIVAVELGAHLWYRAHESNLVTTTGWNVQWPAAALNFRKLKIDEEVRRQLRFDQGH